MLTDKSPERREAYGQDWADAAVSVTGVAIQHFAAGNVRFGQKHFTPPVEVSQKNVRVFTPSAMDIDVAASAVDPAEASGECALAGICLGPQCADRGLPARTLDPRP